MKQTTDSSLRNESLKWWNNLSPQDFSHMQSKYSIKPVPPEETIESIYLKETNPKAIIGDELFVITENLDDHVGYKGEPVKVIAQDGETQFFIVESTTTGTQWQCGEEEIKPYQPKAIIGSGVEEQFKVGAFVVSGAESTVYIESVKYGKQGISVSNFYKENAQPELEETAKLICEAVNNYPQMQTIAMQRDYLAKDQKVKADEIQALRDSNAELLKVAKEVANRIAYNIELYNLPDEAISFLHGEIDALNEVIDKTK